MSILSSQNVVDIPSVNINKNPFSFSFESNILSYAIGNIITVWNIDTDSKQYINSNETSVRDMKLFKQGKYLLTVELSKKNLIISLYENKERLSFISDIKVPLSLSSTDIKRISLIDITPRLEFVLIITSNDQQGFLYNGSINKQSLEISCSLYSKVNIKDKIKKCLFIWKNLWLICANSSLICTVNLQKEKTNIIYQTYNPQSDFVYSSLTLLDSKDKYNTAICTKTGICFIYSFDYRIIKQISYDDYYITSLSYYDGTLSLGTKECCNISYDTITMKEKYFIDCSSKFSSSISNSFLNEQKDSIIISLSSGIILKGKVSSLLKSSKLNILPLSVVLSSHSNTITSIDTPNNSTDNQIVFYTVDLDGVLLKWFYRGDKWSNVQFRTGYDIQFTFCKLHPKYQNELYVGDRMGNVYVFDVDSDIRIINRFKVANFKIDSITFDENKDNIIAIGFTNGMIMMYKVEENKGTFMIKICDDFIDESVNKGKLIKSYFHFFKYEYNKCIYLSKDNIISISNFNYINNSIVNMIEEEISYDRYNTVINDIKMHPSEKFVIVLLDNKQIDIRELTNYSTVGVIDIEEDIGYSLNVDISGEFLIVNGEKEKENVIAVYNVIKGKKTEEMNGLFDIERYAMVKDGRYLILCGTEGSLCIMNNIQRIKRKIFNFRDEERKSSTHIWDKFDILYDKERTVIKTVKKVNKENTINPKKSNEIIIHHSKKNDEMYINDSTRESQKDKKETKEIPIHYNTYTNQKSSNIYASQTVPSSVYNNKTLESYRYHTQAQNTTWKKNHQYTKLGYQNSNYVTLTKDPSIFPVSQIPLIEKVDQRYLKSQTLSYPKVMTNIVENASKKQQDSIRYNNISNAIKNVLQSSHQSNTYRNYTYQGNNNFQINTSKNNESFNNNRTKSNNTSLSNNSYYINNNIDNIRNKIRNQNEPETIDNITNNNSVTNHSISKEEQSIVNRNNYTNTTNHSKKENYEDFSIISTISKNGKYSIADDIDYISDGIERFENDNKNYIQ